MSGDSLIFLIYKSLDKEKVGNIIDTVIISTAYITINKKIKFIFIIWKIRC